MEILGDRKFLEVDGTKTHELPPLLVRATRHLRRLDRIMEMAQELVEQEDILPLTPAPFESALDRERRKMDLAVNLVEQYLALIQHWQWGDSVVEWIRQCETTFDSRLELRKLLNADVWPHANRSSFVLLLEDKHVETGGVALKKAVGMRLTFRQPPPLRFFSDQFLFYLNGTVASTAYQTWAGLTGKPVGSLPPERFNFQVVDIGSTSLD
jgi:hypothetical protein